MKQTKAVIRVPKNQIIRAIVTYGGEIDVHLQNILKAAGFNYTALHFQDSRIMLVMPDFSCAFLYKSEKDMEQLLNLEK